MKFLNKSICSHVVNCLSFTVLVFGQALLSQYLHFVRQPPFQSAFYFQYSRTKKLITAKITCICCCCVFITRINITAWSIGIGWRLEINFCRLKVTQRFFFIIWTYSKIVWIIKCLTQRKLFLSHAFIFSIFLFFYNTIFSLLLLGMGLLRMIWSCYYNFRMLSITFGSSRKKKLIKCTKNVSSFLLRKSCERQ